MAVTKIMILPPGDVGPVCSYSPICSPPSVVTKGWSEQTAVITESAIDVSKENAERTAMERWVTQLVQRELTGDLDAAQRKTGLHLMIHIDDASAHLIKTALAIRMDRLAASAR